MKQSALTPVSGRAQAPREGAKFNAWRNAEMIAFQEALGLLMRRKETQCGLPSN